MEEETTHVAFISWNEKGFWQLDVYENDEWNPDEPTGSACYWCTGKKKGAMSEMQERAARLYPNARFAYCRVAESLGA